MVKTAELGEITPSMATQFEKGFWKCMENNKDRREVYYILYTADWYKNGEEFRDVFRSSAKCPPRMLNTMCWKVDNKSGRLDQLWVLPKDAPIQPIETDGESEQIGVDSVGLPLLYGSRKAN